MKPKILPELQDLEALFPRLPPSARCEILGYTSARGVELPIHAIVMGSKDPKAPVLGVFGGVHGLEKIGTHIALAFLQMLCAYLEWDEVVAHMLEHVRIVMIPIINPGGMLLNRRSNPNGVDLMRNAPVESFEKARIPFVAGQRFSNKLPWYRGAEGAPMEDEARWVCEFVRREIFSAPWAISIDLHSGFGHVDRIWCPYARTTEPFPQLAEFYGFKMLLDRTFPHHIYRLEPQALQYTTHGDLWDYLYDEHREKHPGNFYIPLALELGSWLWIRKNPWQIFSSLGAFNPILPHRSQRILRRHLLLFEFLIRTCMAHERWMETADRLRYHWRKQANRLWYRDRAIPQRTP